MKKLSVLLMIIAVLLSDWMCAVVAYNYRGWRKLQNMDLAHHLMWHFETELHSEIEKIYLFDNLPNNWTYPLIQPKLLEEANRRGVL